MPSISYIYIIFIIASIAIFPYEIVSARFLDLKSCHVSCDKTCKKFLTENEMPTKEIGQVLGLGGTCHCSCCPDGTGMYCFKCYDKSLPEPAFCFNKLRGMIPIIIQKLDLIEYL